MKHPIQALEILANSNFHLTVNEHPENLCVSSLPSMTQFLHYAIFPSEGDKSLHWNYRSREETSLKVDSIHSNSKEVSFDLREQDAEGNRYTFFIYSTFESEYDFSTCSFESYRLRLKEITQGKN
ncbi:hypothetical protein HN832_01350 [archaeon]|jgi:hypothetical protein|nr:hypothetical protein [archaeon]MBT4373047.1 hypothetical protein [archaeon]MBT4531392.1 hypothetical protein [archaeon]MBT7282037.1 hypothetical protein [archaeon]